MRCFTFIKRFDKLYLIFVAAVPVFYLFPVEKKKKYWKELNLLHRPESEFASG